MFCTFIQNIAIVLTPDFVEYVYKSELDLRIKSARELNNKLLLHVEGVGLQTYLERIIEYENDLQFKARQKHAISNKFVVDELLRPIDNIFNAKGGSKHYKFSTNQEENEKEFRDKLNKVKGNQSLSEYVETIWLSKFITDPNGLIFVEVDNDNDDDENEFNVYPTYKSIQKIRLYEQDGINVKWVIFEPHESIENPNDKKKKIEVFWAVDKFGYYKFVSDDEGVKQVEFIENTFGYVPAILCSNIQDPTTGWKRSPIDSQIELLDRFLLSNSTLTIVEFEHVYPNEWEYVDDCRICGGLGKAPDGSNCSNCSGTGQSVKKDVTDIKKLKIPSGDQIKIDPPGGYYYMPTEPWELMVKSIDRYFDLIIKAQWGATKEKKDNETATGRWIDVQPVNNRLSKYSRTTQLIHNSLVNIFGKAYYPETFISSDVVYGQRYLIETPDQIWDKYLKAKEKNSPTSILDLLLEQFIESEYRDNDVMLNYEIKKIKLEPFVHWDVSIIRTSKSISSIDKKKKEYFNEWIKTTTINYINDTDIEDLRAEFTAYVEQIQIINENVQQTST